MKICVFRHLNMEEKRKTSSRWPNDVRGRGGSA
jgi:hypothetical protein